MKYCVRVYYPSGTKDYFFEQLKSAIECLDHCKSHRLKAELIVLAE